MWRRSRTSSPEGGSRAPRTPALPAAILLTVCAVCWGAGGSRPLGALAEEILSGSSYQRALPDEPTGSIRLPVRLGTLGRVLVYALVAYAVFLAIAWVWGEVRWGARAARGEAGAAGSGSGGAGAGPGGPVDPDALARAGRHADAAHALLLAAIGRLARRSAREPSPSSTSRELIRTLPRTAEERDAFAFLVRVVELSFFGGRPTRREDYEAARRRLEACRLAGAP